MNLDRAQASWVLGKLPVGDLPEVGAQMMIQGHEGPAILELASFHLPSVWDVPPALVERAFVESGRPSLDLAGALCREACFLLWELRPPGETLSALWSLVRGCSEVVWNSPLAELAGLALEWDEYTDEPEVRRRIEQALPAAGRRYLDSR